MPIIDEFQKQLKYEENERSRATIKIDSPKITILTPFELTFTSLCNLAKSNKLRIESFWRSGHNKNYYSIKMLDGFLFERQFVRVHIYDYKITVKFNRKLNAYNLAKETASILLEHYPTFPISINQMEG